MGGGFKKGRDDIQNGEEMCVQKVFDKQSLNI